jgi:lysophospholipase L1-like esterase
MRLSHSELLLACGLMLLMVGSSASAGFPEVSEEEKMDGKRVVVVGDSLALGLGEALRSWHPTTSVHAVEGSTSRHWRWNIDEAMAVEAARGEVDLVLVVLGTNDLKPPTNNAKTAEFVANVKRIQETLARASSRVVWIVPKWVSWEGSIATWLGVSEVPVMVVSGGPPAVDGIHLSRAGYLEWSRVVARRV